MMFIVTMYCRPTALPGEDAGVITTLQCCSHALSGES